jgi:hypothetical protein
MVAGPTLISGKKEKIQTCFRNFTEIILKFGLQFPKDFHFRLEKVVFTQSFLTLHLKSKIHENFQSLAFSFSTHGLYHFVHILFRLRPYLGECTASRPICEVKLLQAFLVLGWETTWEPGVL